MTSWRESAAPIISKVIAEVGYSDLKALRKALQDAYPYGLRKMHPYKIWCDEVRRQTQGRLSRKGAKPLPYTRIGDVKKDVSSGDLFE